MSRKINPAEGVGKSLRIVSESVRNRSYHGRQCAGTGFGTYANQLPVERPDGSVIGIDACLIGEIHMLWRNGVTTIECCCGHGRNIGYIAVGECDGSVELMERLGYRKPSDPKFRRTENLFVPKSNRSDL